MLNLTIVQRILLIGLLIGLLVILFGLYQVLQASRRINELAAIDTKPLLETIKDNQTSAMALAQINLGMRGAEVARSQALSVIGFGAALMGITALVYTRSRPPALQPAHPTQG